MGVGVDGRDVLDEGDLFHPEAVKFTTHTSSPGPSAYQRVCASTRTGRLTRPAIIDSTRSFTTT